MNTSGYDVFETSWGWIAALGSEKGIRFSSLPEESPDRALEHLEGISKTHLPNHTPDLFPGFARQAEEYLSGSRLVWDIHLDLSGSTEFFRLAWDACISIPLGETRTYRWLAAAAGRPLASRGAGQAMARNRIPLVIPCHRVVGSDGSLHGFGGPGLPMKARLLEMESRKKPA